MRALIVGGDYVEQIVDALAEHGYTRVEHWNGRKQGDARRSIPSNVSLVVVLTDYTSHPLLKHLKTEAQRLGVLVLYSRRSLVEVRQRLDALERRAA
jgi:hypothetical protein